MMNNKNSKRMKQMLVGVLGAAFVTAATTAAVQAADYPSKPVTLIVPYKAGGSTETMAQVFSKALAKNLGGKVIVKTKPGAGGSVGATFVSKQKPDGYTILFIAATALTWNPIAQKSIAYKADSFTYINGVSEYQMAFISTPDKPFKNLRELVAYSKKNPGVNVADQGNISKVFLNYIAKQEGVDWTPIPTRGGGEMVPFLLGGKVDFAFSGGIHQKYGDKMIVLASTLANRLPAAPDAPSTKELYGISMPGNSIIVGPKGIPADVVAKIEAASEKAINDPDFVKILGKLKFPQRFIGSKDLTAAIGDMTVGLKKVYDATRN